MVCGNIIKIIVSICVIVIMVNLFIYFGTGLNNQSQEYSYECVDSFGNTVYCEKVYLNYGQTYGITEDGITIQIKQYKKVERKD